MYSGCKGKHISPFVELKFKRYLRKISSNKTCGMKLCFVNVARRCYNYLMGGVRQFSAEYITGGNPVW